MIEIREIKTRGEKREFLNFPDRLYKDNPCYVPPLAADERKIFSKKYAYYETCDAIYFGAWRDGKMVGRVSGIIQRASNEKHGEKRVRFTRLDGIDDAEVFSALMDAVEKWGAERGMDTICGPLGFSDFEREGLLVEGFDRLSTFEEQYNAEYYGKYLEQNGYEKEVDWTESMIRPPKDYDGSLDKLSDFVLKRYKLHIGTAKNIRQFIKKYSDGFFSLIDTAYADIYGTVPFTESMKKMMLKNFKLIVDMKHVVIILDENENVVCLGLCFPSIARAVQKSGGRITPAALVRLLHAIKHPKIIDLGLVAADPKYMNCGISAVVSAALLHMLSEDGVEYAETNLNLEDNYAIQNQWKRFDAEMHKRRRAYVKKIREAGK